MSVFGDFAQRVMDAREKQAKRIVYSTLLGFDDQTIQKAGFTREELKRMAGGSVYF